MVQRLANTAAAMEARAKALETALGEALDEFEDALPYVEEQFVEKWGYRDTLARLRTVLPAKGAT